MTRTAHPVSPHPVAAAIRPGAPELDRIYEEVAEGAAARDRDRIHPFEAIDLIRRSRFGALRIRREDGGGGASLRELFREVIRLAAADSNVAHILRNHFTFSERHALLSRDGSHRRWAALLAEGNIIGSASTEIHKTVAGGRSAMTTALRRDGDHYRLNGTKYYSTGCYYSDYMSVRISLPDGTAAWIVIPSHRDGITMLDDWDGAGQRVTGSGTTNFVEVIVHEDEILHDEEGFGYRQPFSATLAQLLLTGVNAGIVQAALRDAVALVRGRTRTFFHAPSGTAAKDTLLQEAIGEISTDAFLAETVVLAAADALDRSADLLARGRDNSAAAAEAALIAAKAKIITDRVAITAGSRLFDVGGASATSRVKNLDRHWRNARTIASHNPGAYKVRAIGDLELNGTPLLTAGFF